MGNCISKINKDHFFVYEGYVKNNTSLEKGKRRRAIEMGIKGGTYRGAHSLFRFSKIMTLAPLQTGVWW